MTEASAILRRAIVVDGCQFTEGDFPGLDRLAARDILTAINLTLPDSQAGFAATARAAGRLWRRVAGPEGARLTIATRAGDIRHAKADGTLALVFALQHPDAVDHDLDQLWALGTLGVRVIQLAYNEASYIGGGAIEDVDCGLTRFGRQAVAEMNRAGITIDLSHCGDRTCLDAAAVSTRPVLLTHANPRRRAPNPRNKPDEVLKAVAASGGVVGVSPWGPICWRGPKNPRPTLDDYLGHVEYLVELLGIDHVSFGADSPVAGTPDVAGIKEQADRYAPVVEAYNREIGPTFAVRYPEGLFGAAGLPAVVSGLLGRGFKDTDIEKFLGLNLLRAFDATWRQGG